VLERLLSIAQERPEQPVVIELFEPNTPGAGVHHVDQPDYLLLNTVAGQLGVYPDTAALGDIWDARARPGPDFLTWCQSQNVKVDPDTGRVAAEGRDVEPEDFLPRRLLGAYLIDTFNQLLETTPSWVTVNLYTQPVEAIKRVTNNSFELKLPSDEVVAVDGLILTVGHTGRSVVNDAKRISDVYPLPNSLEHITAGENVLIEGLGLGAMDVLAALTAGRGGRYQRAANGSHIYHPSGREPIIYIQSREGLPFRARPNGLTQFPRHAAVFLTSKRIAELRKQTHDGRLDFERDIVPLMFLEMRAAAVAVLYYNTTSAAKEELFELLRPVAESSLTDTSDVEALLGEFERKYGAIEPEKIILHSLPSEVSASSYHAWVYDSIETDLAEARIGRGESAIKAALEVWRDLRDRLREVVDFDGLTEASHRQFYGRWHKVINRLVAGPQKERHADLLALCDAGLLSFVKPGETPAAPSYIRISGYVSSSGVIDSDCAPVRDLARLGLIRSKSNLVGIDGIDVNQDCHPRSINGDPVTNLWVLGPLAEGSCYYNHYVTSAGSPSRLFIDAHKAAVAALQIGIAV